MKKIRNRSVSLLLIAFLVICGMIVYVLRYVDDGRDWALYFSRSNSGSTGQLLDRNGVMLAYFSGFENRFADDATTRKANYHVTGDYWNRTGNGFLAEYWDEAMGFDIITGTTQEKHSQMRLNIDSTLNNIMYKHLSVLEIPLEEGESLTELPFEPHTVHQWRVAVDAEGNVIAESEKDVLIANSWDRPRFCNSAMMVCNYRTGELLGMISLPTVDPADSETPPAEGAYINRCLSASFTPGSVFKLVTAAATIENTEQLSDKRYYCEDEYYIAGVPIVCMHSHYNQTFEKAMANSCNVAFAQMAVKLGQDTMVKYVRQYGFLDKQSLDGIPTVAGSYPTEFVGDPELGWSGIGQSTDLVCPYAMLRFVCAIANDGVLLEPKMIDDGKAPRAERFMEAGTAKKLREMMSYNVSYSYGGEDTFPGLNMCAKTGTAEIGDGDTHAWFVGFLDDEEHPYAFVTMVERGGGGLYVAGNTTSRILQEYIANSEGADE
ncbi:MAG: hypothetical protein IJB09_02570 [Oscillospiraceae bacterium]|nr:hypothetical protein [Oscillospiraceae bacterium]